MEIFYPLHFSLPLSVILNQKSLLTTDQTQQNSKMNLIMKAILENTLNQKVESTMASSTIDPRTLETPAQNTSPPLKTSTEMDQNKIALDTNHKPPCSSEKCFLQSNQFILVPNLKGDHPKMTNPTNFFQRRKVARLLGPYYLSPRYRPQSS